MALPLQKTPSGWENLPVEVKLIVVRQLPDLGSLGALFHASPAFYRTCGHDARECAETILASGYICGHTAVLFRLCALIRSGKLPVKTTRDLFERVTGEALCYHMRIRESARGIAPRKLDRDIDPGIVRGLLVTAAHIQNLAGECLQVFLARFKTLRPETNAAWEGGRGKKRERKKAQPYYFDCIDGKPTGTVYETQDMESFEWEEEQRAIRSIWRVQLIYELKRAVLVTKVLEWEDLQVLEATPAIRTPSMCGTSDPTSFYGSRRDYREFLWPVQQHLGSLFYERWDAREMLSPEYEEIRSIVEFVREQHGEEASSRYQNGFLNLSQQEYVPSGPIPTLHPTQNSWKALIRATDAIWFYFRDYPDTSEFPLDHIPFDHFARFGFAFWCKTRMRRYGLAVDDWRRPWLQVRHAWYSITNLSSRSSPGAT